LGIAFPPDWVGVFSYAPGTDSGDRTFPPGTVVNYESDFYLPQGAGLSPIMDTIIVNEHNAEILSKIPQDLIVAEA
jgi:Xaa-Pro aminopeptidase